MTFDGGTEDYSNLVSTKDKQDRNRPHDVIDKASEASSVLVVDVLGFVRDLVVVLRVPE